jgi:hypothetical protein
MPDRYIWHETIQTQHTRRSFRSEVAPGILATVGGWLKSDSIELPGGYVCRIVYRSAHCLEAEVLTPAAVRLVVVGVASHTRCGQPLWERIGGAPTTRPAEPWCGIWLDPEGLAADPAAYVWLGDFERCLAWAFIEASDEASDD